MLPHLSLAPVSKPYFMSTFVLICLLRNCGLAILISGILGGACPTFLSPGTPVEQGRAEFCSSAVVECILDLMNFILFTFFSNKKGWEDTGQICISGNKRIIQQWQSLQGYTENLLLSLTK